jgi:hypothetical protein
MYERAQVVLDLISADLRNMYAENEWYSERDAAAPAPALQCDLDKNNQPRIRFVRDGNAARDAGAGRPTRPRSSRRTTTGRCGRSPTCWIPTRT